MKKNQIFLSENIQFLVMKFSIYFNRRVFVMVNISNQKYIGDFLTVARVM